LLWQAVDFANARFSCGPSVAQNGNSTNAIRWAPYLASAKVIELGAFANEMSGIDFSSGVLMRTKTLDQHIEITPGVAGGKPRIAGHRITVQNIAVWHERLGKTADDIADDHDLTLSEVYAALTYYFDHREEIDKSLEEGDAFVEAIRKSAPSKLKAKLPQ
jgi:uncharacterized protein (DUF433 family)